MREVNFVLDGQTHVDWPAEGLSSTGAPGQPAPRRPCTRCGALPPHRLQGAFAPAAVLTFVLAPGDEQDVVG